MFFFFSFSRVYGVPLLFSFFTDLSVERCLSFSSVPGSEFISEQKIAPKILRKNKVLWRRYSACLINNVNIYHDPESNLELPERNETIRR